MASKRVLSVGQCSADHGSIAWFITNRFGAEVYPVATAAAAIEAVKHQPFDLVLINRVLDADGSPGLDLLRQLKGDANTQSLPVMLVSNFEEAQGDAASLGAVRGFGKASLGERETAELLRPYLT